MSIPRSCHIILTGAIGCGKSTLASQFIAHISEGVVGFQTVPVLENDVIVGYAFRPLDDKASLFAHRDFPKTDRQQHYGIDPAIFETVGVAILRKALVSGKFILMDELGIFEQTARRYCELVKNILKSQSNYLAIIQQRACSFWLQDIDSATYDLYEVTVSNRTTLLNSLISQYLDIK